MRTLLLLAMASSAAAWVQPRMMVSMWYDPVVQSSEFYARYGEMAQANFTAVMGGFGALTVPRVQAQLAAAERAGLGVVAAGRAGYAGYSSTAFWGYQIKDEPDAAEFAGLKTLSDSIAKTPANKGKLRYINLLPTCNPLQLCCGNVTSCGDKSCGSEYNYMSYVSTFVETVQPDVLCMDAYPNFNEAANATADPARDDYRLILAVLRKQALKSKLNFWNYFGVARVFGGESDPTEAQVRWQVFTSLAYGAKGFLYFCYWGDILAPAPYGKWNATTMTGALALTHHYDEAKRINSVVLAWEPYLLGATSTAVWGPAAALSASTLPRQGEDKHWRGGNASAPGSFALSWPQAAPPFASVSSHTAAGDPLQWLVGQFQLKDGRTAILVQNQDDRLSAAPKITLAAGEKRTLCEVERVHGSEVGYLEGFPWGTVQPGAARLYVLATGRCGEQTLPRLKMAQ